MNTAIAVTDEMVEIALRKWFNDEVSWDRGMAPWMAEQFRSEMRSTLSAALTPHGEDAAAPAPQQHVTGDFLNSSTTARGFGLLTFTDRNGTECTLQESSLATEAAIWFGAAKLEVKRFPGNYTGWHDVDFAALLPGQDIVGNERMHLTQDHVRSLLPALQHFAETGELPTAPPAPETKMVVPEDLLNLTFAIQYNPNCPSQWLVRLPGKSGSIDMKPYRDLIGIVPHQTGDVLGFGKTLDEAARAALAASEVKP